jgi:hypothetical protein
LSGRPGWAHRLRARRTGGAGFSLVELIISLVAGLMVAMAVMGVSREATNTFHEEVRVSGAEMGLRIAMERIRLDLQRAAFMSTGNLAGDPMIARLASYVGPTPNMSNFSGASLPYSMTYLSGIALRPGTASVLSDGAEKGQITASPNNLAPDVLDIGGNFSSSDEYAASIIWTPPGAPGTCSKLAAISLEMTTPAGWRIRNAETAASTILGYTPGVALQAAFHPGTSPTSEFLLRLTDQTGHSQYLRSCAGPIGTATKYDNSNPLVPTATIYIDTASQILSSNDTGGLGGVAGFAAGWVTVAPVEIARWDIQTPAQLTAAAPATPPTGTPGYQTGLGLADASDFLLTRSYVDFSSVCTANTPCHTDPYTTEIVSEYAVDLKFGVTADEYPASCAAFPCPNVAPAYTSNLMVNIPMDSVAAGNTNAYIAQTTPYTPGSGPQRIRDVQVRVGIRSPFGDRTVTIAPPTSYLYRYQLDSTSLHYNSGRGFARVREATTEVTLPNQARFYW